MAQQQPSLQMIRYELEGSAEMIRRMTESCVAKCLTKKGDSELHVGELSCLDRCAVKYLQTQNTAAETMQKANQQAQPAASTLQSQ